MFVLLPYPNYHLSAKIFSNSDLRDQIDNVLWNLRYLHQTDGSSSPKGEQAKAWAAWTGHETQLAEYGLVMVAELKSRDRDYSSEQEDELIFHQLAAESGGLLKPDWFGYTNLHMSHQSRLLRHDPEYYSVFFEHVRDDMPTLWNLQDEV